MPSAVRTLVSIYVLAKNRHALERMRELRSELLEDLQSSASPPSQDALDQVLNDLRTIEEGLERLRAVGVGA
jgi:hypothetical protein